MHGRSFMSVSLPVRLCILSLRWMEIRAFCEVEGCGLCVSDSDVRRLFAINLRIKTQYKPQQGSQQDHRREIIQVIKHPLLHDRLEKTKYNCVGSVIRTGNQGSPRNRFSACYTPEHTHTRLMPIVTSLPQLHDNYKGELIGHREMRLEYW